MCIFLRQKCQLGLCCFTWLLLLVNVLRVRATPASTLFVQLGLSGGHLVVSGLSTLTLGTQNAQWFPVCVSLPSLLYSGQVPIFWGTHLQGCLPPGEASKDPRQGWPRILMEYYPICPSLYSSTPQGRGPIKGGTWSLESPCRDRIIKQIKFHLGSNSLLSATPGKIYHHVIVIMYIMKYVINNNKYIVIKSIT